MKSQECYEAIRNYLDIDDSIFQKEYDSRKDITEAELDMTKTPEFAYLDELVDDESTRHIRWPTFEDYRDECLEMMDTEKKPWKRLNKKKNKDGHVVREFWIKGIYDHTTVICNDGSNVISVMFKTF